MEGIRDGLAVDHCFYCDLLYPDLPSCPRCGSRLRYQSARMANAEEIETEIAELVARYQAAPSLAHATALLTFVHEIGEDAAEQVEATGLRFASLRPFFATPPKSPSAKADSE